MQQFQSVREIGGGKDIERYNSETPSTEWTGSTDVSAIAVSTTHLEGKYSLSFAKSGTTQTYGQVSKTLNGVDWSYFCRDFIVHTMNLSSISNVSSISLFIGTDSSNNVEYRDSSPVAGWHDYMFNADNPTAINGTGINWADVLYFAIRVTFGASANTLTAILSDNTKLVKDINSLNTINRGKYDSNAFTVATATTNYDAHSTGGAFSNIPKSNFVEISTDQTITLNINETTNDAIVITSAESPYRITPHDQNMIVYNIYIDNASGNTANIEIFNKWA